MQVGGWEIVFVATLIVVLAALLGIAMKHKEKAEGERDSLALANRNLHQEKEGMRQKWEKVAGECNEHLDELKAKGAIVDQLRHDLDKATTRSKENMATIDSLTQQVGNLLTAGKSKDDEMKRWKDACNNEKIAHSETKALLQSQIASVKDANALIAALEKQVEGLKARVNHKKRPTEGAKPVTS